MHADLVVHDLNRVLGTLPFEPSPTPTAALLRADLSELGVAGCSAVLSGQLYGDPAGGGGDATWPALVAGLGPQETKPRVVPVPVVVPAAGGWPGDPAELMSGGVRLVRACPTRHRWDVDSPAAGRWWETLAEAGCAVCVEVEEVGFGGLRAWARSFPSLRLVALNPGYRELRRCAELLEVTENVVVETGSLNVAGGVEWLAAEAGAGRLAYGSGGPVRDDAGSVWLLRHLELPREQVDRIAHGTAYEIVGADA